MTAKQSTAQTTNTRPEPESSLDPRAVLKSTGGSDVEEWNVELVSRVVAAAWPVTSTPGGAPTQASTIRSEDARGAGALIRISKMGLQALKPQDEVDGMIAGQAVALHHAAMYCLKQAVEPEQTLERASTLRRDAADLSRAMIEMVEALDRRRAPASASSPPPIPTKGPQPTDNPYPPPPPLTTAASRPAPSTIDITTVFQMSDEELKQADVKGYRSGN